MLGQGALLKLLAAFSVATAVSGAAVDVNGALDVHDVPVDLAKRKSTFKDSKTLIPDPGIYPGPDGKHTYKKGWPELPKVDGAKIDNETFTVGKEGATITTYVTENYDPQKIKRAVIQIHGEYRDAWNQFTYASLSAKNATKFSKEVSLDEIVVAAPMFFSIEDIGAYPVDSNNISNTKTLVWDRNGWGDTDDAYYPVFDAKGNLANPKYTPVSQTTSKGSSKSSKSKSKSKSSKSSSSGSNSKRNVIGVSNKQAQEKGPHLASLDALDAYVNFFTDKNRFPNMKTVVIAGFSMGGQTVNRYVTFRPDNEQDGMVNFWISSPASFLYLNDSRPAPSSNCSDFNKYKYGLDGVMPGYVNRTAKSNTPEAIRNRYLSRKVYYFVGTEDTNTGDPSCSAKTQGENHIDRMDNWVNKVMPYMPNNPTPGKVPNTIGYGQIDGVPHLASAVILSSAGMQTLFLDDYNGRNTTVSGAPSVIKDGGDIGRNPVIEPDADVPKSMGSAAGLYTPGFALISGVALLVAAGNLW